MRFRWRRVALLIITVFFALQFAAIYLFTPTVQVEEKAEEIRAEVPQEPVQVNQIQNDVENEQVIIKDGVIEISKKVENNQNENVDCDVTHKDAQSAIDRAKTDRCKAKIKSTYCTHKSDQLFAPAIKRTCKHEKTFIAPGPDIAEKDYVKEPNVKIAYLLIVHGRAIRQIHRLFKLIYHRDHFYYFHVDSRSDYLYHKIKLLAAHYPNVQVAPWREAPIWGGTSLLTTIFNGLRDLIKLNIKWDFFVNLSFADLPVTSNEHLVQFLNKHRNKNFMKSHGREPEKFIKKQGLDRVFLECENHMWRISERPTPEGIIIDGGSDWIALNYEFSKYIIESQDDNLAQLKTWFNYTLLPAESFFHTVVQNTEYCESFVDNNLRMTNWNRARGCKCQYKAIVDWCGCSPNDFMLKDLSRLKTSRPLFFARKFEEFVSQAPVNKLDFQLYGNYPAGTKSLNSYWENIYNAQYDRIGKEDFVFDGRKTIFESWKRRFLQHPGVKKANLPDKTMLHDVTIYQVENDEGKKTDFGYAVTFKNGDVKWEGYVKKVEEKIDPSDDEIEVEIQTGTNWDVKELVFRDLGGLTGTFSKVFTSIRFKNVQTKFKAVALIQDPTGRAVDQLEMEIPEDEKTKAKRPKHASFHCEGSLGGDVVAADKLALRHPMRPGVYTITLFIRQSRSLQIVKSSKTHFTVTPLEFVRNLGIEINADKVNGGVDDIKKINDKDKDLSSWSKSPTDPFHQHLETELKTNSTFHDDKLRAWIDDINLKTWQLVDLCGPPPYFDQECHTKHWSTYYPDPKTELLEVNESGRIR